MYQWPHQASSLLFSLRLWLPNYYYINEWYYIIIIINWNQKHVPGSQQGIAGTGMAGMPVPVITFWLWYQMIIEQSLMSLIQESWIFLKARVSISESLLTRKSQWHWLIQACSYRAFWVCRPVSPTHSQAPIPQQLQHASSRSLLFALNFAKSKTLPSSKYTLVFALNFVKWTVKTLPSPEYTLKGQSLTATYIQRKPS